jgi:leucyl aminopeptidase
LAGKGLSYDTGGADLKTDGHMAGMSRDKGGAGGVAGFVLAAALLQVPGLEIVAELGNVRNSIGPDAFVADEIIRSHGGARVRIGNTDAEGRLVLADLLSHLRARALGAVAPHLFTVATLTGHAGRAVGPYGNKKSGAACERIAAIGETFGELCERSFARREDYAFVAARSPSEDVVSSNRMPSVSTPRGHQFPYAFLDLAAGLRNSGLPFVHIDIAGVAVDPPDWQFGKPTGVPVATLTTLVAEG